MEHRTVKVVEKIQVSPPPGSLPATMSLPLTFFDLRYIGNKYITKHLFFYTCPHHQSFEHFSETTILSLRSSLSLTLQYFYPCVSDLILPPAPQKPYFIYTQGNFVTFIVAEYDSNIHNNNHFDHITSDNMRDVKDLHAFVPRLLPPTRVLPDGTRVVDSLLAFQVTLIQNQCICIGITFRHVLLDVTAFHNFLNSWASICKSNGSSTVDKSLMPSFNRDAITMDPKMESKLLQKLHEIDWSSSQGQENNMERVRSTFVMKRTHIEKLKEIYYCNDDEVIDYLSSFVVTCSFIWVCLINSLETSSNYENFCLLIPADCRNRYGFKLPNTYFGNCIMPSIAVVKRSEVYLINNINGNYLVAARAIGNCIKDLHSSDITNGALRAMEKFVNIGEQLLGSSSQSQSQSHLMAVAGTPRINLHKVDFGWGFSNKADFLHRASATSISMGQSRYNENDIEFDLELKKPEMLAFTRLYYQGLNSRHIHSRS